MNKQNTKRLTIFLPFGIHLNSSKGINFFLKHFHSSGLIPPVKGYLPIF